MEWPDLENPGMFAGFTCNTVWNKNGDVASEINVNNFKNTTTLKDDTQPWARSGW